MNDIGFLQELTGFLDLSAVDECDAAAIEALCAKAQTPNGPVAAVVVPSGFVGQAKRLLAGTGIKTAAQISFPNGGEDTVALETETEIAVSDGAEEIEFVMAYKIFADGRPGFAETQIVRMKRKCGDAMLKVVLEVGEFPDTKVISDASTVALAAGADMLGTSNGQSMHVPTQDQSRAILSTIAEADVGKGFKIGERTEAAADILKQFKLAREICANTSANKQFFRANGNAVLD
ncbi:MAG: deoxyribose-phosphate aldolase [Hyphomicrobiales bacterium]